MSTTESPSHLQQYGAILDWLSVRFALLGGLVIAILATVTVTSIIGRTFFNSAILGDFEITEIGLAVAIFLFLPYSQLQREHIVIDFFTMQASTRTKAILDAIGHLVFSLLVALLVWRLFVGGIDKYQYNESSMLLEIKAWWGYVPVVLSTALFFLTSVYNLLCDLHTVAENK